MIPVCYIVGAHCVESPMIHRNSSDFIIAADGGYEILQKVGIKPDLVVGDFDSLGYLPDHPRLIVHPVEKDDTDLALAVKEGQARGFHRFVLYGGVGGRLDHTLANLALLHSIALCGDQGFLCGEGAVLTAVTAKRLSLPSHLTGTLSVFAVGGAAHGVTLQGLKYPLANATLLPQTALGVSNEFTADPAVISAKSGTLLLYWKQDAAQLCADLADDAISTFDV